MKTCFMFGHGSTPYCILPKIKQAIEDHYINYGVTAFYVGNRGQFDGIASTAVKQVKQQYPDIHLFLVLAYHPAERPVYLPNGFDNSYYPPLENIPRPFAIVRANQHMADAADTIICYVKNSGNTRNLLAYAQQRQKKGGVIIENVAENT